MPGLQMSDIKTAQTQPGFNLAQSAQAATIPAAPFQYTTGGALLGGGAGTAASPYTTGTPLAPIPTPAPGAVTTPIIGAGAATDNYNSINTNTANIANGVAGQAATNAANQAAAAQNTAQGGAAAGNTGTGGGSTPQGGNQPSGTVTAQDNSTSGAVDNSDLTGALNSATDALNAGNGITPPDQNALNTTESGLSDEAKTINDSLTKINSDLSSAVSDYQNNLAKIQNGTFPLSPAQQGLLDQTKSAMDSLVQSAQTQAQLYAQVATTLGARTGLEEFQPGVAIQGVTNAVAKGAAAIADAQFKGVTALAQVQKDIQDEDTTNITDSYNALTKSLDSQQSELEKMATDVQTQAKNTQDQYDTQYKNYLTETQNAVNNAFKATTLTDTEKKNIFDEAMSSANFDEKQKQDIESNYLKQQQIGLTAQRLNLQEQQLALTQGEANAAVANETNKSSLGYSYIDATNLDAKTIAQAELTNIPILKAPEATVINNISAAKQDLAAIQTYVDKFLPKTAGSVPGQYANIKLNQLFQTNDQIAAYNSLRANALPVLAALQTGAKGMRMSQNLINELESFIVPDAYDTVGHFNQQVTNIANTMDAGERSILVNDKSTLPGGANQFSVQTPDGQTYSFSSQSDLDSFKSKAGIK
jgi:hypothetical protein